MNNYLANAASINLNYRAPQVRITPKPPAVIFQNSVDMFFQLNEFTTHISIINQDHKKKSGRNLNKSDVVKIKSSSDCEVKLLEPYDDLSSVKLAFQPSP